MKRLSLSVALHANQILIDSTHISGNQSLSRRTANFLGFKTVFKMCQDGCLLADYGCSGKAFHTTNVGDTCTWIFFDRHSMINVFYNRKLLAELAHMEGSMAIICNWGIVHTWLAAVIPGNEQETTWYHPQVIVNFISLFLASKHFHIIYDIQDTIVSCFHKPNGSYHEFRESFRLLY